MANVLFGIVLTGLMIIAVVLTMISVALQAGKEFVKTLLYPVL